MPFLKSIIKIIIPPKYFFMKHFLFAFILFFAFANTSWAAASESNGLADLTTEVAVAAEVAKPHKATIKEKLTAVLVKKMVKKAERKARKRGIEAPQSGFADIVVLAAAIVVVVGIITIISSPVHGLIVAGIGLLIYLLGKSAGGSLSNIF